MQPNDQLVSKVPSHVVSNARSASSASNDRLSDYNVAAWLYLPGVAALPVTLVVTYQDGEKIREVVVDHGTVNAQSRILLSGIARLPFRRRIEDMQVRLRAAIGLPRLVVEELFVQAVEPQDSTARPIATSL